MRDRLRLPIRVIQRYLSTFHNVKISEGEIVLLLDTAAGHGKGTYDAIRQAVFAASSVHGDETGAGKTERTAMSGISLLQPINT